MLMDGVQTIFAYNTWANRRVFDMAANLSPEQFVSIENEHFSSVHATLFHIVNAQHAWLARSQEIPLSSDRSKDMFSSYLDLRQYWEKVDGETHAFLDGLNPSALHRIIYYTNPQNEANAYPLWHLLYHQINHSAQHRSEVALLLTRFGYSPGWLDFLYYLDLRDGTTIHL